MFGDRVATRRFGKISIEFSLLGEIAETVRKFKWYLVKKNLNKFISIFYVLYFYVPVIKEYAVFC